MDKRKKPAGIWNIDNRKLFKYKNLLYIPEKASFREKLFKRYHNEIFAGHFGIEKITELINRKYYWENMPKNVKFYMDSYNICQRVKMKRYTFYDELNTFPIFSKPWKKITTDFITNLPPNKHDERVYDAILIMVDKYTKMFLYFPTNKTITAI